jgi:hypothetical protein
MIWSSGSTQLERVPVCTATYRTFENDLGHTPLAPLCAPVLAAGIAGFVGMIGLAVLLFSRFTPDGAHEPLWATFKACVAVTLVGIPVGTAAGLEPWSWPSFAIALVLSVFVTTGWALFLVVLIGVRGGARGSCREGELSR